MLAYNIMQYKAAFSVAFWLRNCTYLQCVYLIFFLVDTTTHSLLTDFNEMVNGLINPHTFSYI